ncbi:alpha/beta fold hydrolase [Limnohabitans sp.]|jgi:pimeloyl-ACP methyl ester carboxylesterase|uniref:alpha/beta fold hydrolase n=1 Tax=Limnohabitans sp. TaxID=1907725 RepID=UPI0037BFD287
MPTPVIEKTMVLGLALETQYLPGPAGISTPCLVFLHEGLGSVRMWRDWPAQVCRQLGCAGLLYSRQGYGWSDPVVDVRGPSVQLAKQRQGRLLPDYMHREALEILPALLAARGIERPVLLGHSDGGTIALLHAAHFAVQACIVMAPHVMVEPISLQAIQQARHAFEHGPLRKRLMAQHADVDGAFWQWHDVWLSPAFRSFDIRAQLGQIKAPLLAIQGLNDPYGSMAQIDDIARELPHTQQLKLPDCGHAPHRDQPAAVAHALQAFMAKWRA